MDNLTHSLTGLALARAGLNRYSPQATFLLVLAANAPDCDIVALARGRLAYFEAHRGYTHCVAGLPFMAAFTVAVVALISRKRLPWLRAWLICCAGVASHLLIDWTNDYGIRLSLPFSSRWYHLDLNSLWDGVILSVLIVAALWPSLAKLVGNEIGDRRPAGRFTAVAALMFFLLFDFGRAVLHDRAVSTLDSRVYEGLTPVTTAALPDRFNPLHWTGVVETTGSYRILPLNLAVNELDLDQARVFYKRSADESILRLKATEPFRYFLYFARFPIWSEYLQGGEAGNGSRIDLTDLRFGTPSQGSFHCIGFTDAHSRVTSSLFTFGSGGDINGGSQSSR